MPKVIVSGRGGSGKSTLVTLLARALGKQGKVLVVDTDESNLGLGKMLGHEKPAMTLMNCLGGRSAVREKLLSSLQDEDKKMNLFVENLCLSNLPAECVDWNGPVGYLRIGKIEHSMEGCACPMGAVARSFLKELVVDKNEWVVVDTEAGVEHFGRGLLEGADVIIMVVDPSHESVLLAEKARGLAEEANKKFIVVLNKVDDTTGPVLRQELTRRGIELRGMLSYSSEVAQANLFGRQLEASEQGEEVEKIIANIKAL